jgi:predicted nucleic acid-binding protein
VRFALDSNVLIYAQGLNDFDRLARARATIKLLVDSDIIIPAQALGEVFAVLTRKYGQPHALARDFVLRWQDGYEVAPTTERVLVRAIDLANDHRLSIWDAVMCAAAAEADCTVLLTGDMQDGFVWSGVRVINPFQDAGWSRVQALAVPLNK